MSSRKPPNRGVRGKNIGKFFSVKMNTMVWYESLLEMYLMFLLDFDPGVKSFKEQPCRIHYAQDGKERHYTPDLLVVRADKTQLVEVKPRDKITKYDLLFRLVSPICQQEGYEFLVFTDEKIRLEPRLSNVMSLWRYARTRLYQQYQIYCHEMLQDRQVISLAETFEICKSKEIPKQAIYALLFWGILDFDLMTPLSLDSLIYLPNTAALSAREEL